MRNRTYKRRHTATNDRAVRTEATPVIMGPVVTASGLTVL